MKQLLAWTGSADSTITSEAVMAIAEKFNTGQEVCLQIPSARAVMQVKEGTSGSKARVPGAIRWRPLHSQEMPDIVAAQPFMGSRLRRLVRP